jgi:hypothetical protein
MHAFLTSASRSNGTWQWRHSLWLKDGCSSFWGDFPSHYVLNHYFTVWTITVHFINKWSSTVRRDSSVGLATGHGFDDRMIGVRFLAGASRPVVGLTHPPIHWVPGAFSLGESGRGVKLTAHPHLVPRLRMYGAILPLPQYAFMGWCLIKA